MRKTSVLLFLVFLFIVSCENHVMPDCSQDSVNRQAFAYLKEWYLWYEYLPAVNPASYDSLDKMIAAVKYREGDVLVDRFSYAVKKEEHDNYYAGKRYGMGMSMQRDEENAVYISLVYPESPAGVAGLRRGQRLIAMNGVTVEELDENGAYNREHRNDEDFEEKTDWNNVYNAENKGEAVVFKVLDEGNELETTLYLDDYIGKSVLAYKVLDHDGVKTGYLHFKSFITSSEDELNEVFAHFKKENVERLVLDLRYNGGGLVKIARQLVNLIAGDKVKGDEIIKLIYNNKHQEQNTSYKGEVLKNSLSGINKVAVIVSSGTASASEMVINSLTPYVEVSLIGETTYGKPVGMNSKDICDQTIVPITFKYANSQDYGDFFLGMEADCAASDDFKHDFGDEHEEELAVSLYRLSNGKCPSNAEVKSFEKRKTIEELIPIQLKGMGKIDYTF
ncbi:PDZ domain-containing protein [bacterium]|nr:PDZ domain-containing protein [bacterium]MBP5592402.1 PDZ domain-containing protein [bacterium]